jgi:hypothetical protein
MTPITVFDVALPYLRFALLLALTLGTVLFWRFPARRRPYLYMLGGFVVIYLVDLWQVLQTFHVIHQTALASWLGTFDAVWYGSARRFVAVATLAGTFWTLLLADLRTLRRRHTERRTVR